MCSCYSILECCNLFSGVELSIRWFYFTFNNEAPFPADRLSHQDTPQTPRCPLCPTHLDSNTSSLESTDQSQLDRDVEGGIIKPVLIGTPITWCSSMVAVSKADRTPCCTIDFQQAMHSVFVKPIIPYHHSIVPLKYHLTPKSLYLIQ